MNPTLTSENASAWLVGPEDPDWAACIRLYYVKLDVYHPMLKWFVLATSHLREAPGLKAPSKEASDKSHEFLLGVVDPEDFLFEDFNPASTTKFKFLPPLVLYYQQNRLSDTAAIEVTDRLAQDLMGGTLLPDEGARKSWVDAINNYSRWALKHA